MQREPLALTRRTLALGLLAGVTGAAAPVAGERLLIGSYGGAGCTGLPEIRGFETWLGRRLDVVLDFLQTDTWAGMLGEAAWIADCWKALPDRRLALAVPMLVNAGAPSLAQGAAGTFDHQFRDLAAALVAGGYADAFIRIGWEFNGDWYRWTARNATADFVGFWRRTALTMRGVPGARFRFDWNPTLGDGPLEAAYPGDDVVDVIGLDVYNQSWPRLDSAILRWEYLMHRSGGLVWHRNFAAAHRKPRSFPEWGTGTRPDQHGGGDDALFINNMLAWMRTGEPVAYACYWNFRADDYDAKVTDGRLPRAAAALRSGLGA
jgi:hypothetical protein